MEEIKIDDLMDVIEFKNASVSENTKREGSIEDDELRIYVPPRGSRKRKGLLRFIIMTCVFFLLFKSVSNVNKLYF